MPEGTEMWNKFRKEIREKIAAGQISKWATWGVIKQTMATNTSPLIKFADKFENVIKKFKDIDYIFEFGAGSGQFCKLVHQRGFKGDYTIFDFPELIEIQKYQLKNPSNVSFISSRDNIPLPKTKNNLFISMSAVEESPQEVFDFFLNHGKNFNNFLLKFSGGKSKFEDFMKDVGGTWDYGDADRKGVYISYGKR